MATTSNFKTRSFSHFLFLFLLITEIIGFKLVYLVNSGFFGKTKNQKLSKEQMVLCFTKMAEKIFIVVATVIHPYIIFEITSRSRHGQVFLQQETFFSFNRFISRISIV